VAERERHETEEAKSAVTYRYKQAEADGLLEAVSSNIESKPKMADPISEDDNDVSKSTRLKASVVTEIAHVISASLTSTAKPDTTGLERRVHWRGLGILAEGDVATNTASTNRDRASASTGRYTYTTLEANLPLSFIEAGINFHPLKHNSWVLVEFQNKVWLGNGEYMFVCESFSVPEGIQ
jgi:hypothetical protein